MRNRARLIGLVAGPLIALLGASLGMTIMAVLLGAYADLSGNLHRPLFNTIGPVLVISVSILICELSRGREGQ